VVFLNWKIWSALCPTGARPIFNRRFALFEIEGVGLLSPLPIRETVRESCSPRVEDRAQLQAKTKSKIFLPYRFAVAEAVSSEAASIPSASPVKMGATPENVRSSWRICLVGRASPID
jgi:hypothetical protein